MVFLFIELKVVVRLLSYAKKLTWKFLFLYFFVNSFLIAQTASNDFNFFSPLHRLSFGNHLYFERDYLRALNEFREYLKYENQDTARFRFAECFLRIGRYQEAADNFKGLFYNSTLQNESRLAYLEAQFQSGDLNSFRSIARQDIYTSAKYSREIERLYYITHLMDNSTLPDTNIFFSVFPDSNKSNVRNFYQRKKHPEYKNPVTAAVLSGILPGLGKIYVGEISDGLTSLIATGVLTLLAFDNFKQSHNFRGWLFTGLAAISYTGNIYGSAAAAQIYNAGIKYNFDNDVKIYFEKRNYFLPEKYF